MQSAPNSSASLTSACFGGPSSTTEDTVTPLSPSTARSSRDAAAANCSASACPAPRSPSADSSAGASSREAGGGLIGRAAVWGRGEESVVGGDIKKKKNKYVE